MSFSFEKSVMKDDILVAHFLLTSFRNKLIQATFLSCFIIELGMYSVEVYNLCLNFNYFWKYGAWIMIRPAGMVSILILFCRKDQIQNIWTNFTRWNIDTAGPKMEKKIKAKIRNHHVFIYTTIALSFALGMISFIPDATDSDFILIIHIFEKSYPDFDPTMFNLFCKAMHVPLMSSFLLLPYGVIYGAEHAKYQMYLLLQQMKYITKEFDGIGEMFLLNDGAYQKLVKSRLEFCIKRHISLLHLVRKTFFEEFIRPLFPIVVIIGFLLGLGLTMMVFGLYMRLYESSFLNVSKITLFIAITVITSSGLMHAGQDGESVTDKVQDEISKTRWISWNQSNKKTFLLILQQTTRPIKVSFTPELAINYELGLSMVKGMYSAISLFITMRS